jgi:predicted metal-binding membrane protein
VGGLVVLAWLALIVWGASPYGRYLDHESLAELDIPASAATALFVGGWTLMIVAMMLPTAYPVVALFSAVVSGHRDRRRLLALCIAGYVVVWSGFGYLVYVADVGVHEAVDQVGWLGERPWVVGAAVLAGAGAYQFSDLKYRCLDACRSPRLFVVRRWTGRRPRLDAFAVGADSGLFCLGCCWSLMLVVFAVGAGSIPVMLGLGAMMAAEKNLPWGTRVKVPLAVALALAAIVVVVQGGIG